MLITSSLGGFFFFTFYQKLDRRKRVIVLVGLSGCKNSVENHVDVIALGFGSSYVTTNFGNSLFSASLHLTE